MSLHSRRNGPDRVVVILREAHEGARGVKETIEVARVPVQGRLQESSTDDIQNAAAAGEEAVLHMKTFRCSSFPGDDLSQVLDASGTLYNVVGEPKRPRGSRRTARDVVTLRQAGVKRGVR